jgi:ribosome-binding factor A
LSRGGTREFDRSERVGAELLRELTVILRGVKDPRLGEITLQEVRASRDLSHAKVFFTCFAFDDQGDDQGDDQADQHCNEQARLLNRTLAGYLRAQLAKGSRLRTVPQLHFVHDESVLAGERLAALIEHAVAQDTSEPSIPEAGISGPTDDTSH